MRVMVSGAGGLLAAAIISEFESVGEVRGFNRAALDITDREAVRRAVEDVGPDAVINCAAYNDVDGAEDDAPAALRVNALAVRGLASAAAAAGAAFIHFGTDFVFDGEGTRPYVEEDSPNPRSVYAASKLLGEWFALDHPNGYVLRVESLFGEPGPERTRSGSLGTIVARIRAGESMPVFIDRTVSPGYTRDVARATRELLERRAPPGVYHCVNAGATTWADIAAEAARLMDRPIRMEPLTLDTAALRARRPKYSALSTAKLWAAGIQMPPWQDALARHLARRGEGARDTPITPGQARRPS